MTECEAELRLHDFASDGSMAFLTCDLMLEDHAGLNHHDPVYGCWWQRCDLPRHGHIGQGGAAKRGKEAAGLARAAGRERA